MEFDWLELKHHIRAYTAGLVIEQCVMNSKTTCRLHTVPHPIWRPGFFVAAIAKVFPLASELKGIHA